MGCNKIKSKLFVLFIACVNLLSNPVCQQRQLPQTHLGSERLQPEEQNKLLNAAQSKYFLPDLLAWTNKDLSGWAERLTDD